MVTAAPAAIRPLCPALRTVTVEPDWDQLPFQPFTRRWLPV